jgi:hypothetical protein
MSALYVETSAVLAWLLGESGSAAALHLMGRFKIASGAWITMELTSEPLGMTRAAASVPQV